MLTIMQTWWGERKGGQWIICMGNNLFQFRSWEDHPGVSPCFCFSFSCELCKNIQRPQLQEPWIYQHPGWWILQLLSAYPETEYCLLAPSLSHTLLCSTTWNYRDVSYLCKNILSTDRHYFNLTICTYYIDYICCHDGDSVTTNMCLSFGVVQAQTIKLSVCL